MVVTSFSLAMKLVNHVQQTVDPKKLQSWQLNHVAIQLVAITIVHAGLGMPGWRESL